MRHRDQAVMAPEVRYPDFIRHDRPHGAAATELLPHRCFKRPGPHGSGHTRGGFGPRRSVRREVRE
jgi:hypothetical protein